MKSTISIIILFILIASSNLFAQNHKHHIPWENPGQLAWADFKGRVDKKSKFKALTQSVITFHTEYEEGQLKLFVECFFNKKKSWVKKDAHNEFLLKHEQSHFNITEIYARRLRKRFRHVDLNSKNLQKEVVKLFNKVSKNSAKRQKQYDKETNHSINKEVQNQWNQIIENELKELEEFKL